MSDIQIMNTSGSITAGHAIQFVNNLATAASPTGGQPFHGVALQDSAPDQSNTIQVSGLLSKSIVNLGVGIACAVGLDITGKLVRITDVTCVTKFNHIGFCDTNGVVYIQPKMAENVNVRDFGALGDGITDDQAAIQAAIAFAKINAPVDSKFAGMHIYFPSGIYLCSTQLNFDATIADITHDWPSTTLSGDGGGIVDSGSNRGTSTLIYTGTSGPFISARSTAYFTIHDLAVLYQSNSFTDNLIDLSHSALASDSTSPTFRNCSIGCDASAHTSASCLIYASGAENLVIDSCHISGAVKGVDLVGGVVLTTIRNTLFGQCTSGAIFNPSLNVTIDGCTFENLTKAVASDIGTPYGIIGFRFSGNWCGDANDRTTAWIDPGFGEFKGAVFSNNLFGGVDDGGNHALSQKDSIKLGSCSGVVIEGNSLITIDFAIGDPGSYPQSITIFGNEFGGGNTAGAPFFRNRTNASAGVMCFSNLPFGFDQAAFDQLGFGGHIVTYPTMGVAPGTAAGTHGTLVAEGSAFQGSNDTCGRLTLTVSGGPMDHTAALGTVTFANKFDDGFGYKPKVILMPENAATAGAAELVTPVEFYVVATWTSFAIWATADLPDGTYQWSYIVMG